MHLVLHYLTGNTEDIESHYFEKEYRDDIIVQVENSYFEVYFFTKDALNYEMTKDGYFAFPGLIILDEITSDKIKTAIINLATRNYFDKFNGQESILPGSRFIHKWYVNDLQEPERSSLLSITLS
jgi:hypothetical protein